MVLFPGLVPGRWDLRFLCIKVTSHPSLLVPLCGANNTKTHNALLPELKQEDRCPSTRAATNTNKAGIPELPKARELGHLPLRADAPILIKN